MVRYFTIGFIKQRNLVLATLRIDFTQHHVRNLFIVSPPNAHTKKIIPKRSYQKDHTKKIIPTELYLLDKTITTPLKFEYQQTVKLL